MHAAQQQASDTPASHSMHAPLTTANTLLLSLCEQTTSGSWAPSPAQPFKISHPPVHTLRLVTVTLTDLRNDIFLSPVPLTLAIMQKTNLLLGLMEISTSGGPRWYFDGPSISTETRERVNAQVGVEWKRHQELHPDLKDVPPPKDVFIEPLFRPLTGGYRKKPGLHFRSHRYKVLVEAAVDLFRYARRGSSVHAFLCLSTYGYL